MKAHLYLVSQAKVCLSLISKENSNSCLTAKTLFMPTICYQFDVGKKEPIYRICKTENLRDYRHAEGLVKP